jgi:hypothetical protein
MQKTSQNTQKLTWDVYAFSIEKIDFFVFENRQNFRLGTGTECSKKVPFIFTTLTVSARPARYRV